MKNKKETKRAGKPAPKGDTTSTKRGNKRKAEMQFAAVLNGFEKWSSMMTYIKNMALQGKTTVSKGEAQQGVQADGAKLSPIERDWSAETEDEAWVHLQNRPTVSNANRWAASPERKQ